jgi:hypothetical protein
MSYCSGGGEIRTLESLSTLPPFQGGALDHYATPPDVAPLYHKTKGRRMCAAQSNPSRKSLLLLDHLLGPLQRLAIPAFLPELRLVPIPLQALPACVGARVAAAVPLLGSLPARSTIHFVRHRNLPCYLYFTLLLSHLSRNYLPVSNHQAVLLRVLPPVDG